MLEQDTSSQLTEEQKVDLLEEKFEKERTQYSQKISEIIPKLKTMDTISEAQVLSLSYRQILVDLLHKYKSIIIKHKNNDKNFKKMRIEYYKRNYDMRLDPKEMNEYISSDMALRTKKSDLIENQINFLVASIDTLDKIGWAVKSRIEIHNANI